MLLWSISKQPQKISIPSINIYQYPSKGIELLVPQYRKKEIDAINNRFRTGKNRTLQEIKIKEEKENGLTQKGENIKPEQKSNNIYKYKGKY